MSAARVGLLILLAVIPSSASRPVKKAGIHQDRV